MDTESFIDKMGVSSALGFGLGFPTGAYAGLFAYAKILQCFPSLEASQQTVYASMVGGGAAGMVFGAVAPVLGARVIALSLGTFRKLAAAIRSYTVTRNFSVQHVEGFEGALSVKLAEIERATSHLPSSSILLHDIENNQATILSRCAWCQLRRKAKCLIEIIMPIGDDAGASPNFLHVELGKPRAISPDIAVELAETVPSDASSHKRHR